MISKATILAVAMAVMSSLSIRTMPEELRSLDHGVPRCRIAPRWLTHQDTPCPTFEVQCPDSQKVGDTIVFKVPLLSGGVSSRKPTYKWKASAGKIIGGQGTATIMVDTRSVKVNEVKARVRVGGFPRPCPLIASCSVHLKRD